MPNRGILFFSDWTAPVPLFVVALHSLRKYYSGKVHVMYGSSTPEFFIQELKKKSDITIQSYTPEYAKSYWTRLGSHRCWNMKPVIHQQSPFDTTWIYDCDHVFIDSFDLSGFDYIEKYGLASFHHPVTHYGSKAIGRMNGRAKVIRERLKMPCEDNSLLPANGGCVGSVKGTLLLNEWIVNLEKFGTCGDWALERLPDEFSLSYTLSRNNSPIGDHKWSYSPYPDLSDLKTITNISAIHFCNSSYKLGSYYKIEQNECLDEDYMGIRTHWNEYVKCNPLIQIFKDSV